MEEKLNQFILYLKQVEKYSEHTLAAYATDVQQYLLFLAAKNGHAPTDKDINSKSLKKFFTHQRKNKKKNATLLRRLVSIKRFANYLADQGGNENIDLSIFDFELEQAEDIKPVGQRKVQYLRNNQYEKIIEMVSSKNSPRSIRDLAIIELMRELGLIVDALISLDLDDLNLAKKNINVNGKREKTKFPLTESIASLQNYMEDGRMNLIRSSEEKALFVSQMGGRITRQGVWQMLKRWGVRSNLDVELTPRILRHTAVKRFINQGRSVEDIQKHLGHSNPLSTRLLLRRFRISPEIELEEN